MNIQHISSRTDFEGQARFVTIASVVDEERSPTRRRRITVLIPPPLADQREPDLDLRSDGSGVVG